MLLSALDEHYGITDKVIAGIEGLGDDVNSYIKRAKENAEKSVANAASEVFDYVIEAAARVVINTAKHTLQDFLSPRPRTFK